MTSEPAHSHGPDGLVGEQQAPSLRARMAHAARGRLSALERHGGAACAAAIVTVGLIGGLGFPDHSLPNPVWNSIAQVSGWMYTAAWSLSFYPQFLSNARRRSVEGFSFDFALLNVLGFATLSIYYSAFYLDPGVRRKYREAHGGSDSSVRANDVLFALHALLLTSLTLGQVARFPGGGQRVSTACRWAVAAAFAVIVAYSTLLVLFPAHLSPLPFLYLLSYVKVGVTASKYVPQALLNWRRKSTVGFQIGQILLDLTGGSLSLAQLTLEAAVLRNVSLISGDPVKLFLALLSLGYDALLMVQHYCVYREPPLKQRPSGQPSLDSDGAALLEGGDARRLS